MHMRGYERVHPRTYATKGEERPNMRRACARPVSVCVYVVVAHSVFTLGTNIHPKHVHVHRTANTHNHDRCICMHCAHVAYLVTKYNTQPPLAGVARARVRTYGIHVRAVMSSSSRCMPPVGSPFGGMVVRPDAIEFRLSLGQNIYKCYTSHMHTNKTNQSQGLEN